MAALTKATLAFVLLSLVVAGIFLSPVAGDLINPQPKGTCRFSQPSYSPGEPIILYVHAETALNQPILVGNTPQGQVTVSLGSNLSPGDYSFTVGTASLPSGYREAQLYSYYVPVGPPPGVTVTGSYVEVADCGGYNVQGPSLQVSVSANPISGNPPLSVDFTSSVSGGSPQYSYSWTFGDGSASGEANPVHTYQNPGTYTATLTVTDSSGSQQRASETITVNSPIQPWSVTVNASPTQGIAPLTVSFTSLVTGGTPSYVYNWDFGDGGKDSSPNPIHTYSAAGEFSVGLTVTDSTGRIVSANQVTVVVTAATTTLGITATTIDSTSTTPQPPTPGFITKYIMLAILVVLVLVATIAYLHSKSHSRRQLERGGRFCLKCGRPVRPGASFCPYDGMPVRRDE